MQCVFSEWEPNTHGSHYATSTLLSTCSSHWKRSQKGPFDNRFYFYYLTKHKVPTMAARTDELTSGARVWTRKEEFQKQILSITVIWTFSVLCVSVLLLSRIRHVIAFILHFSVQCVTLLSSPAASDKVTRYLYGKTCQQRFSFYAVLGSDSWTCAWPLEH